VGVVCASISSWQDELVSGASDLQAATTPEEAQQLVGDYLKEVVDATDVMVDEVAGAGVPDVDQGEAIAEDFQTALGSLRDSFQEARAEVESLSADDPITLGQQLEDVGASLQDAGLRPVRRSTSSLRTTPTLESTKPRRTSRRARQSPANRPQGLIALLPPHPASTSLRRAELASRVLGSLGHELQGGPASLGRQRLQPSCPHAR
jgi:hypothetical protein